MKKLLMLLLPLMAALQANAALSETEQALRQAFEALHAADEDSAVIACNQQVCALVDEALKADSVFDYPFDAVGGMGRIYSDDRQLRILSWNYRLSDGSYGCEAYFLLQRLSIYNKVKTTLQSLWEGVMSLRQVRRPWLFLLFTLGIWLCYFLHYYLTFFCFDFTRSLGIGCALVTFIVGSIAVVVPTPNGAGPWHFAVKTMLILYGVADAQALYFVLIVHTVQTLLVVLLGVISWISLSFTKRNDSSSA